MILFRILEHSLEMDQLLEESDKQEDLQSSPYNTTVADDSSHSRDSYVRVIHETHYTLTPHTSRSVHSFPQHTDILTSSTAVNMPTSSTAVNMPRSSSVADIPADPTSSIVPTLSKTESEVSPKNSLEFPIPKYIRASVQYVSKNAVQRNVSQGANNQYIMTVVNLSRELKIHLVRYGALVVGSMLGPNHCKKAVYQLIEARINKS